MSTIRHELIHDYNFDGAKDLPSDEVEDAYEMMVFLKKYRKHEETVPFPLYKSSELDTEITSKWEKLVDINLNHGATFLADPALNTKHIPGVLYFFASLVKFDGKKRLIGLRMQHYTTHSQNL